MERKLITVFFVGSLLMIFNLFSCKGTIKKNDPIYTIQINFSLYDTTEIKLSELYKDFRIIPLVSDSNIYISLITKVLAGNKYIYVLSKRNNIGEVFKFLKNGKFVSVIGRDSKTYLDNISDIDLNTYNGHITIFDPNYGIYTFDCNDMLIKKKPYINSPFIQSSVYFTQVKNSLFFVGYSKDANLYITDENFNIRSSFFSSSSYNMNRVLINPLQKTSNYNILYRRYLHETIYSSDGINLLPYIFIDFGQNYPENLFDPEISKRQFKQLIDKNKLSIIGSLYENSKTIGFTFKKDNSSYYCFFDKKNKTTSLYNKTNVINDISFDYKTFYCVGSYDSAFIYITEPEHINTDLLKQNICNKTRPNYSEKKHSIESFTNNKYPIIVIAEIK